MIESIKGKGRANDETSSLLPSLSPRLRQGRGPLVREDDDEDDDDESPSQQLQQRQQRMSIRKLLCGLGLGLLVLIMLSLVILHLCIGHLVSERSKTLDVERGLVLEGIHGIRIVPSFVADENQIVVEIEGRAGIDVRRALGWDDRDISAWATTWETQIMSRIVKEIKTLVVQVEGLSIKDGLDAKVLMKIADTSITLPVSYRTVNSPRVTINDFKLSLPFTLPNPKQLGSSARRVVEEKRFDVIGEAGRIIVGTDEIGGAFGWIMNQIGGLDIGGMSKRVNGDLPDIPSDPSSLVVLDHYSISETNDFIALNAVANITNPLHDSPIFNGILSAISLSFPYSIPVEIYLPTNTSATLPSDILLARVSTSPFSFTKDQSTTSITIEGQLVNHSNSTESMKSHLSSALSSFLAKFLNGQENSIHLKYDATSASTPDRSLPPFVTPLMSNVTIPLNFPGSTSTIQLFKNLEIADMKIRLSSLSASFDDENPNLLCSGRVVGEINLPQELNGLSAGIDIGAIWPDVYVFNGDPPPNPRFTPSPALLLHQQQQFSSQSLSLSTYPPSTIPLNAFGRLHPTSYILSSTSHIPSNSTHPSRTLLSASFVDAPLFLLPGRSGVLRDLVAKLVFGRKEVRAGIRGVTDAKVVVKRLGEVEVKGLPIEGGFFIQPQNPGR